MTCLKHAAAALFAVLVLAVPAQAQYSIADRYPQLEERPQAQRMAKKPRKVVKAAQVRKTAPAATARAGQADETMPTPFGVKIPANKSLDGYPAPLAEKTREIVRVCGSRIVSTYRPGARVRGSGRVSLHASKRAVDVAGNPTCIRRLLDGWPGGMSSDYYRVGHYHFSYAPGGREWGARFAHWRPGKKRRLAHR